MNLGVSKLSASVRLALSLGAVVALGASTTAFAQDTSGQQSGQPSQSSDQKAKQLQTVVVTGSLIRRVDVETSSPVVTIDRAAIEATGKMTLGDLVQQLPAMTGGAVNPQVNNGGGTGGSAINLRGLGANRTLILVDGQRVLNTDPNSIPANMIERIEVLTDGASATYGSDAIGGVVNFILRHDYQGAQFTTNVGQSDHDDGEQSGYSFTFGQTSDKGSIMGGIEYNKQDGVEAGNRKFSKNSVSLYGTNGTGPSAPQPVTANIGGSSSSPYGHIQLPAGLAATFGCGYVALNPGGNSQVVSTANYHCYQNNGAHSDKYNYATVNLIMTPQERTNAFLMGTYNLSDNVQAYANAYFNKTSSEFQLAPAVYGSPYGADISADNYWNQFGTEFSQSTNAFTARLKSLGNRATAVGINNAQFNVGFKGSFTVFNQDWNWDAGLDYGHSNTVTTTRGLPNTSKLYTGASYMGAAGLACVPNATTAAQGCPTGVTESMLQFNPFDLNSAGSVAALQAAGVPAVSNSYSQEKVWHAGINGGLFDLPAGTVQLAAGADYRQEHLTSVVDPLLNIDPATGTCVLGSQCSSSLAGGYNVKEVFAETFIPVLSNLPGVKSLNITIGDRYSRFSTFGSTNDFKFALEYKPIDDLLLRGTMSQVFRAPDISEVYGAPASSAPKIATDPCTGYTGSPVDPACVNVPTSGPGAPFINNNVVTGTQLNAITSGSKYAGFPIKPEQGKSFDVGAVYSPSWAPGLSATVDVWHLYLNDDITSVNSQEVLNLCAGGQTEYCPLITRNATPGVSQGQIISILQPTANLGTLSTGGIDMSMRYKLPQFAFGQFTIGLDATYLKYYNQETAPGTAGDVVFHDAGHFLSYGSAPEASCPGAGTCLFPRWRAQGFVDWQMGNWSASWRMRYIGRFQMGSQVASQDVHPDGACYWQGKPNPAGGVYNCTIAGAEYKYAATVYNDLSFGYNIEPLNTRVDFGVNNAFDKQPPVMYANNTLNANTDPSDFDLMGRYYWARVTVKF